MVTDRCATTCLIVVLGYFYPAWMILWQTLIALDISSHWVQMYSSLLHGESTHKVTDLAANPIMRFYYTRVSRNFYYSFLLLSFSPKKSLCFSYSALETSSSLLHSTSFISLLDSQVLTYYIINTNAAHFSFLSLLVTLFGHSIGMWYILAGVSLPISFLKQVVSLIQLVVACRNLGALDVVARARQRDQHPIVS